MTRKAVRTQFTLARLAGIKMADIQFASWTIGGVTTTNILFKGGEIVFGSVCCCEQVEWTIGGVANGTCGSCATDWNTTFTLSKAAAPCRYYLSAYAHSACYLPTQTLYQQYDAATKVLTCWIEVGVMPFGSKTLATWTKTYTSHPDCSAWDGETLTLTSSDNNECDWTNATLSITSVAPPAMRIAEAKPTATTLDKRRKRCCG